MAISTLLVDDEKLARSRLRRLLSVYPDIQICAEAANGKEALDIILQIKPDLIFLDIRMPLLSGFEMLKELETQPHIIFTTAFNEYALQAFDENTIDYLLKPIAEEKLERAVIKARKLFAGQQITMPDMERILSAIAEKESRLSRFSSRIGDKVTLVSANSVWFFKAEDKYTFLHAAKDTCIVSFTLKELEQRLDPAQFVRVHRNAIINLSHIQSLEKWFGGKWKVFFDKGVEVVVSANYIGSLKERIGL